MWVFLVSVDVSRLGECAVGDADLRVFCTDWGRVMGRLAHMGDAVLYFVVKEDWVSGGVDCVDCGIYVSHAEDLGVFDFFPSLMAVLGALKHHDPYLEYASASAEKALISLNPLECRKYLKDVINCPHTKVRRYAAEEVLEWRESNYIRTDKLIRLLMGV